MKHGESNYLPVGTTLHAIAGFETHERLAVWDPFYPEWRVLLPLE